MSYDYGTQDSSETVYSSVMPLEKNLQFTRNGTRNVLKHNLSQVVF